MAQDDWFRNTSWSEEDQRKFFARLKRARRYNRAQYLRIQAGYLQDAGHLKPALDLLARMIDQHPEKMQLAQAHLQKAQCLVTLDRPDEAEQEFRAALDCERRFPGALTQAWIEFGWFAVRQSRQRLYQEVLKVLDDRPLAGIEFPIDRYKTNAVRSLIASEAGDSDAARTYAARALEAASLEHSGLRYHPTVGLVEKLDAEIHKKIESLAG